MKSSLSPHLNLEPSWNLVHPHVAYDEAARVVRGAPLLAEVLLQLIVSYHLGGFCELHTLLLVGVEQEGHEGSNCPVALVVAFVLLSLEEQPEGGVRDDAVTRNGDQLRNCGIGALLVVPLPYSHLSFLQNSA